MRARLRKWGNSLAIRIPKVLAREAALVEDAEVELGIDEGRLVVRRIVEPEYALDELLEGVTPQNLHGETPTGERRGREEW